MPSGLENAILAYGKPSDLKVICEGQQFHVHQERVVPRCKTIAAMFRSGMQEQQLREIAQNEFDLGTVGRWLAFLYIGDCDTVDTNVNPSKDLNNASADDSPMFDKHALHDMLVAHDRVYGLADYYEADELRAFAYERFGDHVSTNWHTKDAAGVADVVREVCRYSRRKDTLREFLHGILHDHFPVLVRNAAFVDGLGMLEGCQDFVADMLPRLGNVFRNQQSKIQAQKTDIVALRTCLKSADSRLRLALISFGHALASTGDPKEQGRRNDQDHGLSNVPGEVWPGMDLSDSVPRGHLNRDLERPRILTI